MIDPLRTRIAGVLFDKAEEVLIVEGEKDADNLVELGFAATISPMKAKKWWPEYNEVFKGKDVILVPNNEQESREHMAQAGAYLKDYAASLKWLDLPDLTNEGDVSDWLASFDGDKEGAAERLAIMLENAKKYEPPKRKTIEDAVIDARQFTTMELPPKRSILTPWLTEQSIILVSGWRGVGKSWFALSLLNAINRGEPFGPWETTLSVPCLYMDSEMAAQDTKDRLGALKPVSKSNPALYIYSDAYANSLGLPRANLMSETWRDNMKNLLTTRGIKVWVIDNLASLTGGIDENVKKEWDPINSWLLELRFAGISTIMLHHVGKTGNQRGTSAREDNIDASIVLRRPFDYTTEDGARFILHFSKARVCTRDLPMIKDMQFQLQEDEDGGLAWTWEKIKKQTKVEAVRMLSEGAKQEEIASILGISKGRVSQIKSEAIKDNLVSKNMKLTQSGMQFIQGMET